MKKKLTVLGLLYGLGFVIGGCIDCNCTEFEPRYQDYSELSVAYDNIVEQNDSLKIRVQRGTLEILSEARKTENPGSFIYNQKVIVLKYHLKSLFHPQK